jgi:hypothetical protein
MSVSSSLLGNKTMPELAPSVSASSLLTDGLQARRYAEIRRQLQRLLGRKPSPSEKFQLDRAARLSAKAEAVAADARATTNDVVRIDRLARLARLDWQRLVAAEKAKATSSPLATYLESIGLAPG